MPVKDLTGSPPPSEEEKIRINDMFKCWGPPLPDWLRFRGNGGIEPLPSPSDPKPAPMTGGAEDNIE